MVTTEQLLDLTHTLAAPLLKRCEYPWQALEDLTGFILKLGETLDPEEFESRGNGVWIAKDAKVFPTAWIDGPCIIGHGTEVRHCAFIRGSALVGDNCVVGNSTELKNAILFDNVQVPHYNYVGDSVLGYHAHMGAGSILSNVKGDNKNVIVHDSEGDIESGRRKFGAILGDFVDVGCNSVLNPGTVVGRRTRIYPLSCVRGTLEAGRIYKSADKIVEMK